MEIIAVLAEELGIKKQQAEAAVKLIDEGNTKGFRHGVQNHRISGT